MKQEIQDKIDELKAQINELEAELKKPEKWQPKGGSFFVDVDGTVCPHFGGCGIKEIEHGLVRSTRELAERSAKAVRAFNRLLAYRDEFFPEWETCVDELYYVARRTPLESLEWDMYGVGVAKDYFDGRVLFSHSVAKELVRKLNSGEVEL